ncbi:aldo/keto reductase [Hymenobacter terricola]|uniref:aldo/keto reductase n=1 Tax=Hymenobacter terricola TaxID=2819236 RepID=UPI001CF5B162|nr:aldo/keto reductase [Hymenobacter terricola]
MFPRYQGENFYKNLELVTKLRTLATAKGLTSAQLALAWVLAQGVVAVPGTRRRPYLEASQRSLRQPDADSSRAARAEGYYAWGQRGGHGLSGR